MRPEILFPLFAPVSSLKGVGPKIAPLVEKASGPTVRDLLFTAPQGMIDRAPAKVMQARAGAVQTFVVTIDGHAAPARRSGPYVIRTIDDTGFLFLNWFKGYGAHLLESHAVGARRVVSGRVELFGDVRQIAHPDYFLPVERLADVPRFEAVYGATAGLPSRTLRRLAHEALLRAPELEEWQDAAWRARQGWMDWREALNLLHAPETDADLAPEAPAPEPPRL